MHGNTVWTPEKKQDAIERLCASVASGMSLTRSLAMLDDVPDPRTFWGWMAADEEIGQKVARAREAGVEVLLEEGRDIADEAPATYATELGERVDPGHVAHRKLQIETRVKYAQMIAPRKYGPKIDLTTGGDKLHKGSSEIAAEAASLLALAQRRKDEAGG